MPEPLVWVVPERVDLRRGGGGGIRHVHLLRHIAPTRPVRLVAVGPTLDETVAGSVADVELVDPADAFTTTGWPSALTGVAGQSLPEIDAVAPFIHRVPRQWLDNPSSTAVLTHLSTQHLGLRAGPVIAQFHHCSSVHLADEAAIASNPATRWRYRRYAHVARRLEREAVDRADLMIGVSQDDLTALGVDAASSSAVVPNGVDAARFADLGRPSGSTVLLPGSLDYGPNTDGARFFVKEVWQRVTTTVPDARLVLAGRDPGPETLALGNQQSVEVRPDVDDMVEEFAEARVVVVPLRYGTGTRLKVLEALAAGRSVVATNVGVAGLDVADGVHLRVADSPEALAESVIAALRTDDHSMHAAGRRFIAENHEWEGCAAMLLAALDRLSESE